MKNLVMHATRFAGLILTGGLFCTAPAMADWHRSFVVEWHEPAFYHGGAEGVTEPGTDCPAGTNPELSWPDVLGKSGYSDQEIEYLMTPTHPFRLPNMGQNQYAYRGEGRANIYMEPWTYPDTGLTPVTGTIGEGLDLDGDTSNGFVSPDGETGIDNETYHTLGCWHAYRGPVRGSMTAMSHNDHMREGAYSILIVVSGKGDDPMNDDNVQVGFYDGRDALVKDARGNIAKDYSFIIAPHAKYETIFDARTVNGEVISKTPVEAMWMQDHGYTTELELLRAQLRFSMNDDGTLTGYLAGYRPWYPLYMAWVHARGTVMEAITWVELPSVWYALKRNADYSPDGADGERTHISYAMRITAIPAYVMVPDASEEATDLVLYTDQAPPYELRPHPFLRFTNGEGVVEDRDGVLLAGPNAVIPPPNVTREKLKQQRRTQEASFSARSNGGQ
ncbi:MAG: hypothetical protein CMK07_14540 [Ponticaulis sp.]|nr:hypothetical protein [Ponticaulis sp.]